MSQIEWKNVFDEIQADVGASDETISDFTASALQPLTPAETGYIQNAQRNPFPKRDPLHSSWTPFEPGKWIIPIRPFPDDYLQFLRFANGAECRTGDRWFQFFSANDPSHGVRATLLAYHVPEYMSGAVPFAFNGAGTFYMFDMRQPSKNGSYPVVCCGAGALAFDDNYTVTISDSFVDACQGTENVDNMRFAD